MKIKNLLIALGIVILVALLAYLILYNMGKQFCDKEKEVPFRYHSTGGLFSEVIKVETTEDKKDGYTKICVEGHKPNFFDMSGTLRYVVEKTKENETQK
jgi:PDZ domain-containing secreted protein